MVHDEEPECVLLSQADLEGCAIRRFAAGCACYCSMKDPLKPSANEDSAALVYIDDQSGVIAVADGFGGQPSGDRASNIAISSVVDATRATGSGGLELREAIMNAFERANDEILALGVGAATTLTVVELNDGQARAYHAGDSELVVVGQRGKVKLTTVSHSPVGYALEAGIISERDALHHDDRHLVSNMVGSAGMRIDVGPTVTLRPRDTLLVASDGLFDNMSLSEIVETVRKGPLLNAGMALVGCCRNRMLQPQAGEPSKPDDLTLVLFRR